MTRRIPCRIIAAIAVCFATAISLLLSQTAPTGLKINKLTDALVLKDVQKSRKGSMDITTLSFQNVSGKVISAYAISYRNGTNETALYEDWFDSDSEGLSDGESTDMAVPSSEIEAAESVSINAVVFADGSSEGIPEFIDSIGFNRLGQIYETARLKPIFETFSAQSPIDDSALSAIAERIKKLPESTEEAFVSLADVHVPGISIDRLRTGGPRSLHAFLAGTRKTREDASHQIEHIKQYPESSADASVHTRSKALEGIRNFYAEHSAKHIVYLQRSRGGN